jgi:stage V sporulation protein G
MKITQVKIKKQDMDKLKAFASVTVENKLVLTGMKVIEGKNGLFVAMPSNKKGEEYFDIYFPITKEFRQYIIDEVLKEYNKDQPETPEEDNDFSSVDEDSSDIPF